MLAAAAVAPAHSLLLLLFLLPLLVPLLPLVVSAVRPAASCCD
jgi:hypothetical protein